MMRLLLGLLLLVALASVVVADGKANDKNQYCLGATCFDRETTIGGATVPLRGAGTLRWWGFKVYSAAFYTPNRDDDAEKFLGSEPHRLVLNYYRDIAAADIVKASNMALDQNPDVDRATVQPGFDRMNALYVDVKKGDRYELVYQPAIGTSLVYNGTVVDTVEGEEFARALFGIWLSKHTIKPALRDKLLSHR